MRVLTIAEVGQVGGSGEFWDTVQDWTKIGGATGTFLGYVVTGTVQGATKGGVAMGAMGFAFGVGYGLGTMIYDAYCY